MREDEQDEGRCRALSTFIRQRVVKDPRAKLGRETPLVSSGLVDSLSLISILAFVEDEFGVLIPDEAATAGAMDSIGSILRLIDAYEGSGRG